jgi:hypothetical protein
VLTIAWGLHRKLLSRKMPDPGRPFGNSAEKGGSCRTHGAEPGAHWNERYLVGGVGQRMARVGRCAPRIAQGRSPWARAMSISTGRSIPWHLAGAACVTHEQCSRGYICFRIDCGVCMYPPATDQPSQLLPGCGRSRQRGWYRRIIATRGARRRRCRRAARKGVPSVNDDRLWGNPPHHRLAGRADTPAPGDSGRDPQREAALQLRHCAGCGASCAAALSDPLRPVSAPGVAISHWWRGMRAEACSLPIGSWPAITHCLFPYKILVD